MWRPLHQAIANARRQKDERKGGKKKQVDGQAGEGEETAHKSCVWLSRVGTACLSQ